MAELRFKPRQSAFESPYSHHSVSPKAFDIALIFTFYLYVFPTRP